MFSLQRLSERYIRQGGVLDLESGEEESDNEEEVSVQEMTRRLVNGCTMYCTIHYCLDYLL